MFKRLDIRVREIANGYVGHVSVHHGDDYTCTDTPDTFYPALGDALDALKLLASEPGKIIADHPINSSADF